jgi:hypothetical protein
LKTECLTKLHTLKRYRILTLWGTIRSHGKVQREKAVELQRAQVWLMGSVTFLFYLLLHVAFVRSLSGDFWIALGQSSVHNPLGIPGWQNLLNSSGLLGGLACGSVLGLTLALVGRYSIRCGRVS